MATFEVRGTELHLHLSRLERLEAFHGDVAVPLATVRAVRAVDTAWDELRGVRAPGTGIPGVIAAGTRRGGFGKDFAVVHGRGPAVVVELEGAAYGRLVATASDAEGVAARIRAGVPG